MNGFTRILAGAAVAGGLVLGTVTIATPAEAVGTPGCVSKSEFRHLHNGQTQAQVKRIAGANGKTISAFHGRYYSSVYKEYKMCHASSYSSVDVSSPPPASTVASRSRSTPRPGTASDLTARTGLHSSAPPESLPDPGGADPEPTGSTQRRSNTPT